MRELTEIEKQNESFLNERNIHFVKVLMTENILSHHIFDATQSICRFLKEGGVHDYDMQQSGDKTYINTHLLTFKEEKIIKTSVYKSAKRGDKRMWFGAEILPITSTNDIFIMMIKTGNLYILNISHINLFSCCISEIKNPIKDVFK